MFAWIHVVLPPPFAALGLYIRQLPNSARGSGAKRSNQLTMGSALCCEVTLCMSTLKAVAPPFIGALIASRKNTFTLGSGQGLATYYYRTLVASYLPGLLNLSWIRDPLEHMES